MNRTICAGLMALPVYLYNSSAGFASSGVPFFQQMFPITVVQRVFSTNTQLHLVPWAIAARDDQPEDCLRLGICKD
ncbi:hypothetical protein Cylst_5910 [Cylindrospermum stagnale PCC 7417]|uniref:Secreted protein n=1 Tax=Cylindrospermum stagnale PCC 7417 TaxID=56107 RepID=K9X898_9NOST|nr:hypothetical protein [Cylindrospermum stagnale]AFZ27887.1 hypothetical protein Cylst_5910 [Cylindrospermum stagnale PCC 7417]